MYEIGVDLSTVKDAHAIAFAVSSELGMDYDKMINEFKIRLKIFLI